MTSALKTCKTTCPYCGVGCGVELTAPESKDNKVPPVSGDLQHPANLGRLCVKGSALADTLSPEGRLLSPKINGVDVSWSEATQTIADKIKQVTDKHGPDAFAFYLSGQILTEDYYVANKLAKGFIGTANVDTNSRLCMASAVVGYKRAFGSDTVPCNYEDLETCDLLILVGSNAAWTHPVLYQRMMAAKKARPDMKVVVIDPRETATCDFADLHLAIAPGTDALIFNALLAQTQLQGVLAQTYIEQHTQGFEQAIQTAIQTAGDLTKVASEAGIAMADLQTLTDWWCATEKTVTFYSQGVNQSSSGVDKCNAIINCHLATGRIGREGMGPFSITGQPNAMGGREVGGLANQLAAHMDFHTPGAIDLVQRFWQAPNMASENGLKAVDMFNAIEAGKIKVVWIMSTNPMVSLPDTAQIKRALEKCDMVIVSDCQAQTDTTVMADVLLPASGWSEKDGTVTNSERRISRQRGLLPAPGEAKADWWAICEVAKALGYEAEFNYLNARDIFVEHAALSAFENQGQRDFDIGGLSQLTDDQYDALMPIQWPVNRCAPNGTARMFADNHFFTPSGKANFVAIEPRLPKCAPSNDEPFVLNTGRVRDQWHTMTRTGKAEKLSQHIAQPYVDIHPSDAKANGIAQNQLVRVQSRSGEVVLRANVSNAQTQGQLFAPIHWTEQFAGNAVVSNVIPPTVDPLSGQPESKHATVNIEPINDLFYGFIVSSQPLALDEATYWCGITREEGFYYEIAVDARTNISAFVERLEAQHPSKHAVEKTTYHNPFTQTERHAVFDGGQLKAAYFFSPNIESKGQAWLASLVASSNTNAQTFDPALKLSVNAGRLVDAIDKGKTVCSCFNIGENEIKEAIQNGCDSQEALTAKLKCGSNCGSCIPELNAYVANASLFKSA